MVEENITVKQLEKKDYERFENVYEDFVNRAVTEYKFELTPLGYNDFLESYEKGLIKALVLYEDKEPTAFLVYTTAISEAVELNIIHSLNLENLEERSRYLVKEFLQVTKREREDKIVCYPMLGAQKAIIGELAHYGFRFVGIAVLRFLMHGTNSRDILNLSRLGEMESCYKIVEWSDAYFEDAVRVVQEAFEDSADALFDPRFKSLDGTYDILNKIVGNIYAEFMPETTSVLLCNDEPVGFCFMNLTGGRIANIPIVGIKKEHRSRGLSKYLLKNSLQKVLQLVDYENRPITEVNTTTETNNFQALKMYRHLGFKEDYNYPQSYLPMNQ